MVLVTKPTVLIPRIQSKNVGAVMVMMNDLPNSKGMMINYTGVYAKLVYSTHTII